MKIYGHPWSINTRKTLMTLAEKGHDAELALVMIPKGEHKQPRHVALHPFGKVPVLKDASFVLIESLLSYPGVRARLSKPSLEAPLLPVLPVCFRKGTDTFSYFSTVTTLGTPQDITVQEIRIECFFPVDDATRRLARALAAAGA